VDGGAGVSGLRARAAARLGGGRHVALHAPRGAGSGRVAAAAERVMIGVCRERHAACGSERRVSGVMHARTERTQRQARRHTRVAARAGAAARRCQRARHAPRRGGRERERGRRALRNGAFASAWRAPRARAPRPAPRRRRRRGVPRGRSARSRRKHSAAPHAERRRVRGAWKHSRDASEGAILQHAPRACLARPACAAHHSRRVVSCGIERARGG
jgi:hypothetical protein